MSRHVRRLAVLLALVLGGNVAAQEFPDGARSVTFLSDRSSLVVVGTIDEVLFDGALGHLSVSRVLKGTAPEAPIAVLAPPTPDAPEFNAGEAAIYFLIPSSGEEAARWGVATDLPLFRPMAARFGVMALAPDGGGPAVELVSRVVEAPAGAGALADVYHEMLDSGHPQLQDTAVYEMESDLDLARDGEHLRAAFQDLDPRQQATVARMFGAARDAASSALLMDVLDEASSPQLIIESLRALGRIGTPDALDVVTTYRQHAVPEVRVQAEIAAGAIGEIHALMDARELEQAPQAASPDAAAILSRTSQIDEQLRSAVRGASTGMLLGWEDTAAFDIPSDPPPWVAAAVEAAQEEAARLPSVTEARARSLAVVGEADDLIELVQSRRETDPDLARAVAKALSEGRISARQEVQAPVLAIPDRMDIFAVLGLPDVFDVGGGDLVGVLIGALQTGDPARRVQTASWLGRMQADQAVQHLLERALDGQEAVAVRIAALYAIAELAPEVARRALSTAATSLERGSQLRRIAEGLNPSGR